MSSVFLLARELRRHMQELMAQEQWAIDAGFRPPCLGVLAVVAHAQPISQRAIGDHLGLDASDVTGVVDILERAGFVERRRDPDDRRRHAVVLTVAGEQAAAHVAQLRSIAEDRVLGHLAADERARLVKLLDLAVSSPAPPSVVNSPAGTPSTP